MAEISATPDSQSGEEIKHAKKSSDVNEYEDPSLSEKVESYDLDEEAVRIADEDLNRKKKQVWGYLKVLQASWILIRCSQTYKGWMLLWLAFQSTGVIYGDIGTRYVFITSKDSHDS